MQVKNFSFEGNEFKMEPGGSAEDTSLLDTDAGQPSKTSARIPLVVKENLIDEDRVKYLLTLVTTRADGVDPSARLLVLPHMLKDSSMPRMINMEPYQRPTLQQLVLTGLPSVLLCGTPNYVSIETNETVTDTVPLCIPSTLAENSFHGPHPPLLGQEWNLEDLKLGRPDKLSLITAPKIQARPV
ncbi:hypothetical protein ACHAQJ_008339 [Trichoderma viride]